MPDLSKKQKLLDSATREFLEFGYTKASLRRICNNAGVTTGAVYFFFKDKADVYDSIVGEVAEEARQIIDRISRREVSPDGEPLVSDESASIMLGESLVNLYFNHPVEAKLLLECSQGSNYEDFIGMLHDCIDSRLRSLVEDRIARDNAETLYDNKLLDWMTHMEVEGMLYALSVAETREEALDIIRKTVIYMKAGFNKIYRYERSLLRKNNK